MEPQIIYKDENIVAVNKPAGLLVHPGPTTDPEEKTLVDWVAQNFPETKTVGDEPQIRPGIIHRLDRDTSGILIIARNQESFEFLKQQFKDRKIQKTYTALCAGKIKNKTEIIDIPIGRSKKTPTKRLASLKARGKLRDAITEYKVKKEFLPGPDGQDYTLLEAYPKTGRTHQIRVHLKAIGLPIICDKLYTKKPLCPFGLDRHFLHASALELKLPAYRTGRPDGGKIKLEADLTDDLKNVLENLEK